MKLNVNTFEVRRLPYSYHMTICALVGLSSKIQLHAQHASTERKPKPNCKNAHFHFIVILYLFSVLFPHAFLCAHTFEWCFSQLLACNFSSFTRQSKHKCSVCVASICGSIVWNTCSAIVCSSN